MSTRDRPPWWPTEEQKRRADRANDEAIRRKALGLNPWEPLPEEEEEE